MVTVNFSFSKSGYCSIGLSHRACLKSLKLFLSPDPHLKNASFSNKFNRGFVHPEKSLMNLL